MSNIKYFGFVKESSSVPVYGFINEKSIQEALKVEVPKVIARLKDLSLVKDERQRIKSEYGCWFCKRDDRGVYYIVLCAQNYPQRHIYAAINTLKEHLMTLGDYQTQADATLRLHSKQFITQLCYKYNDLSKIDKIGEASKIIDSVDIDEGRYWLECKKVDEQYNKSLRFIKEGLKLKRQLILDEENAQIFQISATEVEREMYCRNCKMKIIIAIVIVALICVIVIPIATTVGKK